MAFGGDGQITNSDLAVVRFQIANNCLRKNNVSSSVLTTEQS